MNKKIINKVFFCIVICGLFVGCGKEKNQIESNDKDDIDVLSEFNTSESTTNALDDEVKLADGDEKVEDDDEKLETGESEGKILGMLIYRTYINKTNNILIEFLEGKMKVYKMKDCENIFDENNVLLGDLLYDGKLNIIEKKNEFYYIVDGKEYTIKYNISEKESNVITLEYANKKYEFEETYVPVG